MNTLDCERTKEAPTPKQRSLRRARLWILLFPLLLIVGAFVVGLIIHLLYPSASL